MPKQRISSPQVAEPAPGLWSNAIRAGDFLFVAGMVSRSSSGTIEGKDEYEQSKIIFTKIRRAGRRAPSPPAPFPCASVGARKTERSR
jgi:2-iminobutanoate/2-iminopropanoate deaminase